MLVSPCLNVSRQGASATDDGREFHAGTTRGKKLCFKVSFLAPTCLSLREWFALVLACAGWKYFSWLMSMRLFRILKVIHMSALVLLDCSDSQPRWSSMEVTLLLLLYLAVTYLAALLWMASICNFWSLWWGLHTVLQYSRCGRTMVL